ncbi:glycogen-binding domain-containing protein [Candidatus Margulisiibacteriota bacterium]
MAAKKTVKKTTAKPAAKTAKKAVKKTAVKAVKKPVAKTVKKVVKKTAASKNNKKQVTITYSNPNAGKVSLAGDFNNWSTSKNIMKAVKKGVYSVKVTLSPGTYSYKFCTSKGWFTDPKAECVYDENGNQNSKLVIG